MTRRLGLIGIPSSIGAHWPGQEKAPRALREAGLVEYIEEVGLRVTDRRDLPATRFRPDPGRRHPQNLAAVVDVARFVADRVEVTLRPGEVPLVIGGDCTIELGVISGFLRAGEDPPEADVPQINAGLTFREALACLGVFAASPKFAGLILTEFNPDHTDEEGEAAAALVRGVVDAVAGKKAPERLDDPTDREGG
jgi:arginase family enzyme